MQLWRGVYLLCSYTGLHLNVLSTSSLSALRMAPYGRSTAGLCVLVPHKPTPYESGVLALPTLSRLQGWAPLWGEGDDGVMTDLRV